MAPHVTVGQCFNKNISNLLVRLAISNLNILSLQYLMDTPQIYLMGSLNMSQFWGIPGFGD